MVIKRIIIICLLAVCMAAASCSALRSNKIVKEDYEILAKYITVEFEFSSDTVKVGDELRFSLTWHNISDRDVSIYPGSLIIFNPSLAPDFESEDMLINWPEEFYKFNSPPAYTYKVDLAPDSSYTHRYVINAYDVKKHFYSVAPYFHVSYIIPLETRFDIRGSIPSLNRQRLEILQ